MSRIKTPINKKTIDEIRRVGFARLRLKNNTTLAKIAIDGFSRFLNLSMAERKRWTFEVGRVINPQIGYIPREEAINQMTGNPYDHKAVFHFDPSLESRAVAQGVDIAQWKDWMGSLSALFSVGVQVCEQAVTRLLITRPDLQIKKVLATSQLLRILYYPPLPNSKFFGQGHKDEWFFTVNIYESMPGLKVGPEGNVQLLERDENTLIIYPGKKAEAATNGELKALYHEIDGEILPLAQNQSVNKIYNGRFAITFFFDA